MDPHLHQSCGVVSSTRILTLDHLPASVPWTTYCLRLTTSAITQVTLLNFSVQFSSVQSLACVQLFADTECPWTAAFQASLSITISWRLPKLMSIESVMPTSHLILYCPPLLLLSIFPRIRVFSSESLLCSRWPKYWSFSFSINHSNEYLGLISFRVGWLELLVVQGTLKSLLQHHSQKHQFFNAQLSLSTKILVLFYLPTEIIMETRHILFSKESRSTWRQSLWFLINMILLSSHSHSLSYLISASH